MPPRRLCAFDSIRGLAALSVVFSHFFLAYGFPEQLAWPLTNTPLHIFWDGFAAVSMFFVLSGYVLSKKYFSSPLPPFARFACARAARIWLPYFSALTLSYAFYLFLPPQARYFTIETDWLKSFWVSPAPFARQALLVINDGQGRFMPQDWTLTLELIFSLGLPPLVWVARRASWAFLAIGVASLLGLKAPILSIHFCLGILLARHESVALAILRAPLARWTTLAAGLVLYTFRFSLPVWFPGIIEEHRIWYVTGVGAVAIVAFVLAEPVAQRWLARPALVYLGAISYALYLVHFAVLESVVPRVLSYSGLHERAPLMALGIVTLVAVSTVCAHVFRHVADAPAIAIARRILRGSLRMGFESPEGAGLELGKRAQLARIDE